MQQPAGVVRVVLDACHDIGAAEPLRILERPCGDGDAPLEVDQVHDDRRRAEVDGQTVEGRRQIGEGDPVTSD